MTQAIAFAAALAVLVAASPALAETTGQTLQSAEKPHQDRTLGDILSEDAKPGHSGYYYPPPQSEEVYRTRLNALPNVSRKSRIGLVAGITKQQNERHFAPGFHLLAKGAEAEVLILVAVEEGRYDTLYRLRALLAALSAEARFTELFQSSGTPEQLNFLDLLKLAGFEKITISNGKDLSHTILIR